MVRARLAYTALDRPGKGNVPFSVSNATGGDWGAALGIVALTPRGRWRW